MKKTAISLFAFLCIHSVNAQQFIDKAMIEFEVKSNIKKTMGDGAWAEMMKENLPSFKIAYYQYSFSGTKSIFKLDHFDEKIKIPDYLKKDDEENQWYVDHNQRILDMKKNVVGSAFYVKDSLPAIQWKLTNEHMVIAGFNCRKAVGKIFDSVYVFVFYTDEIPISGGPCSISGLPGMVLGMTIPRLFTSWIATKISITGVNEAAIKPTVSKKPFLQKEYKKLLSDRTKEWENYYEDKSIINRFLWGALL
ncbi:MAG: GLPGLI family protein [Ferruginibacter sp.]|nr:GLPGLI family protein [Ferruginibacter sp.]